MVAAGRAAVAAAGVEVSEQAAGLANGFGLILFLDVHVEGVEVDLHVGRADCLDELEALIAGVEEIGLKAVERLDAKINALFAGVGGEDLQVLHD